MCENTGSSAGFSESFSLDSSFYGRYKIIKSINYKNLFDYSQVACMHAW